MTKLAKVSVQVAAMKLLAHITEALDRMPTVEANQAASRLIHALMGAAKDFPVAVIVREEDGTESEVPTTELRPAHFWNCPNCLVDNFEYTVSKPMDAKQEHDIAVQLGLIEDWQEWEGDIALVRTEAPGFAKCENCGTSVACCYENTLTGETQIGGTELDTDQQDGFDADDTY